jgi:hypothetical protein
MPLSRAYVEEKIAVKPPFRPCFKGTKRGYARSSDKLLAS